MKELIVTVGLMILGCMIFSMIAGDGDSLRTAGEGVMRQTLEAYQAQQGAGGGL